MIEAMRKPAWARLRSGGALPLAGGWARSANGAALRWTPGPDELRLPECEDEPVPQNDRHAAAGVDCFESLRLRWWKRPDVAVSFDQFVHWDPAYDAKTNPDNPPQAPDVYVSFGVAKRPRSSYVTWEEGKAPDFVLEVASPSSRRRDEKEKPGIYARMGVRECFLYDPDSEEPTLLGFELHEGDGGERRPLPEERLAGGVVGIRSKVLGLYLCIKDYVFEDSDIEPECILCCYDPVTARFLPIGPEMAEDNRRAKAKVAELTALIEKMRRDKD